MTTFITERLESFVHLGPAVTGDGAAPGSFPFRVLHLSAGAQTIQSPRKKDAGFLRCGRVNVLRGARSVRIPSHVTFGAERAKPAGFR